jgi:hypothetical protein
MVLSEEILAPFDTEFIASNSEVCVEEIPINEKTSNDLASSKCEHQKHATSSEHILHKSNSAVLGSSKRDHPEDPERVARVQLAVARAVTFAKRSAATPPLQWKCFKNLAWDWRPAAIQQLLSELHYVDWVLLLKKPRLAVAHTDVDLIDLLKEAKHKLDSDYDLCLTHLKKWLEDSLAEQAMRCIPQPACRPASASRAITQPGQRREEQVKLDEMRSQEAARRREEADKMAQEKLQKNFKEKQAKHRHILRGGTRAREEEVLNKSEMRRSQSAMVLRRKTEAENREKEHAELQLAKSEVRSMVARQKRTVSVKQRASAAREENEQWQQIAIEIRRGKERYEEAQRAAAWRAATQEMQNASNVQAETLRDRAEQCKRKRELREDISFGLREAMQIMETQKELMQLQTFQGSDPGKQSSKDCPNRPQSAESSTRTRGPLSTDELVEQIRSKVGSSWRRNVMGSKEVPKMIGP